MKCYESGIVHKENTLVKLCSPNDVKVVCVVSIDCNDKPFQTVKESVRKSKFVVHYEHGG